MQKITGFFILATIKTFSHIFYRAKYHGLTPELKKNLKDIRLFIFLNHTSLFEPIYVQALPYSYLWHLVGHMSVPGADITLNRPVVGRFWKMMMPNITSVTRKKDSSWEQYLKTIKPDSIIMIAPEGRMKRPGGLDKFGKPMTVRGGVADIIEALDNGLMLVCLSGGLHHVQSPGEHFPRLFKKIEMNLISMPIKEYKAQFSNNPRERKLEIVQDLQKKLETNCPTLNK